MLKYVKLIFREIEDAILLTFILKNKVQIYFVQGIMNAENAYSLSCFYS